MFVVITYHASWLFCSGWWELLINGKYKKYFYFFSLSLFYLFIILSYNTSKLNLPLPLLLPVPTPVPFPQNHFSPFSIQKKAGLLGIPRELDIISNKTRPIPLVNTCQDNTVRGKKQQAKDSEKFQFRLLGDQSKLQTVSRSCS